MQKSIRDDDSSLNITPFKRHLKGDYSELRFDRDALKLLHVIRLMIVVKCLLAESTGYLL